MGQGVGSCEGEQVDKRPVNADACAGRFRSPVEHLTATVSVKTQGDFFKERGSRWKYATTENNTCGCTGQVSTP